MTKRNQSTTLAGVRANQAYFAGVIAGLLVSSWRTYFAFRRDSVRPAEEAYLKKKVKVGQESESPPQDNNDLDRTMQQQLVQLKEQQFSLFLALLKVRTVVRLLTYLLLYLYIVHMFLPKYRQLSNSEKLILFLFCFRNRAVATCLYLATMLESICTRSIEERRTMKASIRKRHPNIPSLLQRSNSKRTSPKQRWKKSLTKNCNNLAFRKLRSRVLARLLQPLETACPMRPACMVGSFCRWEMPRLTGSPLHRVVRNVSKEQTVRLKVRGKARLLDVVTITRCCYYCCTGQNTA
jgi:hypothetical protein